MTFSPFNKAIVDIEASDLSILRTISEGWHVEYKLLVPNAPRIGKSVSAFANTYGGWLFYGVGSGKDGHNCADAFTGIKSEDWPSLQMKIRDAVAQHVNPTPHFDCVALDGPCADLGLAATDSLIVVHVPQGNNPPYVHSSGRIYRRVADRSDPSPENERRALDQLWERSRVARERFREFIESSAIVSKAEESTPRLSVFLFPDPWGDQDLKTRITLEEFTSVMKDTGREFGEIPFDNIFSAHDGFIARQVADNDPYNYVLTYRHYYDGTSVACLPLRCGSFGSVMSARYREGYDHFRSFCDICQANGLKSADWLDVNLLVAVVAGFVQKQEQLMKTGRIVSSISVKVRFENVWRKVPFIDTESYIAQIQEHGVPVIQDDDFFVPVGATPNSVIELKEPTNARNNLRLLEKTVAVWGNVTSAIGLQAQVASGTGIQELLNASGRATKVHSSNRS